MADKSGADEESNRIPRHVPSNPYNYTPAQLAERKKTVKDLAEIYPSLPFAWLEMAYDFEKNTPRHRASTARARDRRQRLESRVSFSKACTLLYSIVLYTTCMPMCNM